MSSRKTTPKSRRIYVLNTGGTLGMTGIPMRPAKSAAELLDGINIHGEVQLTLVDFPLRQDSTNVMHRDRMQMAEMILAVYRDYDGFVIMHGTDSLAESCAFFAMAFKGSLQKPLIIVGAQMGKDESGSDVKMQLENTFRVVQVFIRNQIVGVFNVCIGNVLDGARVRKKNDSDFDAFSTPGTPLAASIHPHMKIADGTRRVSVRDAVQGLRLDSVFEQHVCSVIVSADTPPYVLMDMVAAGRIKGVILQCKGAGNIPDREWSVEELGSERPYSWIDAIAAATKACIHVGIISPFDDGRVNLERYELGAKAKAAGAISLGSLTPPMGGHQVPDGHGHVPQRSGGHRTLPEHRPRWRTPHRLRGRRRGRGRRLAPSSQPHHRHAVPPPFAKSGVLERRGPALYHHGMGLLLFYKSCFYVDRKKATFFISVKPLTVRSDVKWY